tara:strand:+ start:181 stop:609 length:429 start_codon:yes stop_codon:yes gene_type:complete
VRLEDGILGESLIKFMVKSKKLKRKKSSKGLKNYIFSHWNGSLSLSKSFWINGFILNIVFAIPLVIAELSINKLSQTAATLFLIYFVLYVIFYIWVNVGIWRSSSKYISNKKNSKFWGYAARVAVILSVLRAIGESVSGFLV